MAAQWFPRWNHRFVDIPMPIDGLHVGANPFAGAYEQIPCRPVPERVRHIAGLGWVQGARRLRKHKNHYALVWPKDGKRGSKMGRLKDILNCKGPDMFVVIGGRKGEIHEDRPTRGRWTRWTPDMDEERQDEALAEPWWVRPFREQRPELRYDFRSRTYRMPRPTTWTNALYRQPNRPNEMPYALRDVRGQWLRWQRDDGL